MQVRSNPACYRMRAASAAEGRQPRLRTRARVSRGGAPPLPPPARGRTALLSRVGRGIRPHLHDNWPPSFINFPILAFPPPMIQDSSEYVTECWHTEPACYRAGPSTVVGRPQPRPFDSPEQLVGARAAASGRGSSETGHYRQISDLRVDTCWARKISPEFRPHFG